MGINLFVDDWRRAPDGWMVARSNEEAISILKKEKVETISLDYIIGESPQNNFSPVAEFIANMPDDIRPCRVRIHTSSSEGARRLRNILGNKVEYIA